MRAAIPLLILMALVGTASAKPARLAPCPDDEEAAELWPAALGTRPDDEVELYACTPGHFGGDGWTMQVWVRRAGTLDREHDTLVIEAEGRRVLAHEHEDHISEHSYEASAGTHISAADLDGDGVDELLREVEGNAGGSQGKELEVFTIKAGTITELARLDLDYENAGSMSDPAEEVSCSASWSLRHRGKRVELVVRGRILHRPRHRRDLPCALPGRHRYRIKTGKLVEIR
jgi:hypothetical protein